MQNCNLPTDSNKCLLNFNFQQVCLASIQGDKAVYYVMTLAWDVSRSLRRLFENFSIIKT